MEQKKGLRNFCQNIKPTMTKCREGKRLTKEEQETIVQFYLEVVSYLGSQYEQQLERMRTTGPMP